MIFLVVFEFTKYIGAGSSKPQLDGWFISFAGIVFTNSRRKNAIMPSIGRHFPLVECALSHDAKDSRIIKICQLKMSEKYTMKKVLKDRTNWKKVKRLTEKQIIAAAKSDSDNKPLTKVQ